MKAKPKRVGARAAGSCLRASGAGLGALGQSNHVAQTNLLFGQIRRRGVRVPVSAGAGTTARLCALTKECTRGVSDLERRGGVKAVQNWRVRTRVFWGGGAAVAKRMREKVDGGGKTMKGNLGLAGC